MKKSGAGGINHNMLWLNIDNENILYSSYLPFLKNGGLFIPTEPSFHKLGDDVTLFLTLKTKMFEEKFSVSTKVVWINPKHAQGARPAGIGVHFINEEQQQQQQQQVSKQDNQTLREKIEKALMGLLESDRRTYTM